MTTVRLYNAIKEKLDAQAIYEAAIHCSWGPNKALGYNDPLVARLRAATMELNNALSEAKDIIEAPTESHRRVAVRCAGERDVARHLLHSLAEQGFVLQDSEDEDGEWVKDPKVLLELLMDLDMLRLQVRHTEPGGGWDDSGWILLVRGNSPEEMISDYTTNLEQYLKPTFRYIKSFYDPTYIIEGE